MQVILSFFRWVVRFFSSPPVVVGAGPKWFELARGEIGISERVVGDEPRILEYHSVTTLKASEDSVPWCSSFVCWCLERSGIISTGSAWARSFLEWGVSLDAPRVGCVVVLSRGSSVSTGHVGFFVKLEGSVVWVLSGNQNNNVGISSYDISRVLGYRWPVSEG